MNEIVEYAPLATAKKELESIEPIYETLPGWSENTFRITKLENLPQAAINYIKHVLKS